MTKQTAQIKTTFKPIKKHINATLRPKVIEEFGRFSYPPHKIVMRTTKEFITPPDDDATDDVKTAYAMQVNPYISVDFTALSHQASQAVNYETLKDLIEELHEFGFIPDDVTVAFSPYNLSGKSRAGTQRIVFIFDEAVYGAESEPVSTPVKTPPPPVIGHRPNPMDYLT